LTIREKLYINYPVYFKGSEVGILRYPVTVMGKIRQLSATGLKPGKADGKTPPSQETLVYIASVGGAIAFQASGIGP